MKSARFFESCLRVVVCVLVLCGAGIGILGCTQTPPAVVLHSMRASGSTSFVCWGTEHKGYRIEDCPDYTNYKRHLYGLVTQTETNEVAVVDVSGGLDDSGLFDPPQVLDEDPTTPGYTFLRVGARPGAIVSTPGGAATFVGVSGLDKNGLFALPTSCISPPAPGQPARDVTTWAACSLPSAPGDMALLIEPPDLDGPTGCSGFQLSPHASDALCPVDLSEEVGPVGRRILAVALAGSGDGSDPNEQPRIALVDAQTLLDRHSGSFDPCPIQGYIPLNNNVPATPAQTLPADLVPAASCAPAPTSPTPAATQSLPGGFALSATENRLYLADRALPVIHVFDTTDACALTEQAPLQPTSYLEPTRVVTTSRVAVSPMTPAGQQFVYAVDEQDQPASVMIFDVSAGATDKTPLVLPGAPRQPFVPPDRIRFTAPVRDVAFALRDFPSPDPSTGVGSFGTLCDPNPNQPATTAGAQHEPNPPDYTVGARPADLRGVFGFAMMTTGQIGVIDVDDFDAPCRRPTLPNTASGEDFQGCFGDVLSSSCQNPNSDLSNCFSRAGVQTVTGESSCRMVEQHRPRSVFLSVPSPTLGVHYPALRAFPQFSNPNPGNQSTGSNRPQLLGVNFPNPAATASWPSGLPLGGSGLSLPGDAQSASLPLAAQVYIGVTPYSASPTLGQTQLDINPSTSQQNSVVLPLNEPRSYSVDDTLALTYEGKLINNRRTGFLRPDSAGGWQIYDADGNFCSAGVEDPSQIGAELGTARSTDPTWASEHADYVQMTGDFPPKTLTSYWNAQSAECTYDACLAVFGAFDNQLALSKTRELRVDAAYYDHLQVSCRD
ncbi:MAG TPA: hypothetical protein VGI10_20115, partial [Polyangiaceae bacterium]